MEGEAVTILQRPYILKYPVCHFVYPGCFKGYGRKGCDYLVVTLYGDASVY